jgi:hypothetical protein
MLKRSPRYTPWVHAALATLEGALTGDPSAHLEAAEQYGRIGDATARVLALVHAARAMTSAGNLDEAEPIIAEITEFARRNRAPRLLDGLPVAAHWVPATG